MTEKQIETAIIDYINALPRGWAIKINSGNILKTAYYKGNPKKYMVKLAPEGTPDIIACIKLEGSPHGFFCGIEVKKTAKIVETWHKQKDRRSQAQWFALESIDQAGGKAFIVHSLDDFISLFEETVGKLPS